MVQKEVGKRLKKGAVIKYKHEVVYATHFLGRKKGGTHRLILNLNSLKKYLEYKRFKMQARQTILTLIQPIRSMLTIDLKYVYYSIKIDG